MMLWQFLCINFGYKTKKEVEAMSHYNSTMGNMQKTLSGCLCRAMK